ncbi:hypothetical protein B0H11DRAFT_591816 [Mycena galericulata]|nr:hypothetical protein B0H11DRAFT_591816 [Mycena galericulata]
MANCCYRERWWRGLGSRSCCGNAPRIALTSVHQRVPNIQTCRSLVLLLETSCALRLMRDLITAATSSSLAVSLSDRPSKDMRRFFGLDPPRVTLKPTPFLRRASGDAWQSPSGSSSPSSTSSPISAGQTWAPVNTVANQDDLHELVNKIRFLSSMGSEDRPLILEVCDRASSNTTAREAIRALMHEFKHGSAAAQLSAARLWAILLRNSSAAFIAQSTAADFLEAIEALLASTQTAQVVRHRVLRVLGDAVFSNPAREPFRTLWVKVKPADQPDHRPRRNPSAFCAPGPIQHTLHSGQNESPDTSSSRFRFSVSVRVGGPSAIL